MTRAVTRSSREPGQPLGQPPVTPEALAAPCGWMPGWRLAPGDKTDTFLIMALSLHPQPTERILSPSLCRPLSPRSKDLASSSDEALRKCLQAESALGPPQAPRYNSSRLLRRLMRAQCPRSPAGEFNLFLEIRFPSLLAAWALIATWCSSLQLPSLGSIKFRSLRGAAQPDLVRARWVRQLPGYHAAVGWEHCLLPNWLYQPQRTPFSCADVCKCNSIKPFT